MDEEIKEMEDAIIAKCKQKGISEEKIKTVLDLAKKQLHLLAKEIVENDKEKAREILEKLEKEH